MANLLDMQKILGGTPSYMYQPPVADVDKETQKLIDQLSDEEKRKPQFLINLLKSLGGLNEAAEERARQTQLRRERSRIPVDQERLLSPFRAQPVNPLQGQDLRIGDNFRTSDLLNPDMLKVPPRQQVLMSESKEKPVASAVDVDNNQQSNNTDNTQNNVDLDNVKSEKNQKLGLMLYALGGALKGDKNFVENTIQIQQMQESKKKKKAQKEAWEEAKVELSESNPSLSKVMDVMTPEQGIDFYIKYLTPEKESVGEIKAGLVSKVLKGEKLTKQEFNALTTLDPDFYTLSLSQPDLFSFSDENGGDGMDTTIADTPQNFQGTSEQWAQLKASNSDKSDQELIDWYAENYGN